jgi:hypothetical protein
MSRCSYSDNGDYICDIIENFSSLFQCTEPGCGSNMINNNRYCFCSNPTNHNISGNIITSIKRGRDKNITTNNKFVTNIAIGNIIDDYLNTHDVIVGDNTVLTGIIGNNTTTRSFIEAELKGKRAILNTMADKYFPRDQIVGIITSIKEYITQSGDTDELKETINEKIKVAMKNMINNNSEKIGIIKNILSNNFLLFTDNTIIKAIIMIINNLSNNSLSLKSCADCSISGAINSIIDYLDTSDNKDDDLDKLTQLQDILSQDPPEIVKFIGDEITPRTKQVFELNKIIKTETDKRTKNNSDIVKLKQSLTLIFKNKIDQNQADKIKHLYVN